MTENPKHWRCIGPHVMSSHPTLFVEADDVAAALVRNHNSDVDALQAEIDRAKSAQLERAAAISRALRRGAHIEIRPLHESAVPPGALVRVELWVPLDGGGKSCDGWAASCGPAAIEATAFALAGRFAPARSFDATYSFFWPLGEGRRWRRDGSCVIVGNHIERCADESQARWLVETHNAEIDSLQAEIADLNSMPQIMGIDFARGESAQTISEVMLIPPVAPGLPEAISAEISRDIGMWSVGGGAIWRDSEPITSAPCTMQCVRDVVKAHNDVVSALYERWNQSQALVTTGMKACELLIKQRDAAMAMANEMHKKRDETAFAAMKLDRYEWVKDGSVIRLVGGINDGIPVSIEFTQDDRLSQIVNSHNNSVRALHGRLERMIVASENDIKQRDAAMRACKEVGMALKRFGKQQNESHVECIERIGAERDALRGDRSDDWRKKYMDECSKHGETVATTRSSKAIAPQGTPPLTDADVIRSLRETVMDITNEMRMGRLDQAADLEHAAKALAALDPPSGIRFTYETP